MQDINRKPDGERLDPGHFERMLELELMQKRAAWQQARAKRGIVRALAYLFLFLIISAGVLAYFLFLPYARGRSGVCTRTAARIKLAQKGIARSQFVARMR